MIDTIVVLTFYPKLLSSKHITLPKKNKKTKEVGYVKSKSSLKMHLGKFKLRNKKRLILIQLSFIVILSLALAYLIIFKLQITADKESFFSAYIKSSFIQTRETKFLYTLAAVILFPLFFLFSKNTKIIKRLLKSVVLSLANIASFTLLGLLLVIIYSTVETINLKHRIFVNPQSLGIYTDADEIVNQLKSFDKPPQIVGDEINVESFVISQKLNDKGDFYKGEIVPITVSIIPSIKNLSSQTILLVNSSLVITEIDKEKIETISPTIGRLLVKKTLGPRYIKDEPNVNIMGRQEYLKYRDDQINEAVTKINDTLALIDKGINISYGSIQTDKNEIASYESLIDSSISNREIEYNNCINAICYTYSYSYYTGYYSIPYRCNSDWYCNSNRGDWDSLISQYQSSLQDWKNQLAYDRRQLAEFQEYKELFEISRELTASQKEQTPYELGVFEPDNTIKVVLENTDSSSLADFYATLVHEYLHYSSYISEERVLDGFFEEGLTEYFSRKTIQDNLEVSTNLGYPLISAVIEEMTKKVPEDRLEEIYFTKNHDALVSLLNKTYSDNFYDESQLYFTLIYYAPSREALNVANNIIIRIGGSELTEDALRSTYSEFD